MLVRVVWFLWHPYMLLLIYLLILRTEVNINVWQTVRRIFILSINRQDFNFIFINFFFELRIGTFYSPMLPLIQVIKLFILFYVKKVCVIIA